VAKIVTAPDRPEIGQSVVFTYTDDLEAGSKFFSEILELDLVVDQGACHIYRLTETSFIGVCDLPGRPTNRAAVTITIVSDAVDEWHAYLTANGVVCEKPPSHNAEFGVYSSLFTSPDGYRIEIQRFDDNLWAEASAHPNL
jgi:catechol 2,3-dioxygenase-like lactoylglutathione lyase family enzyme